MADLEMKVYEAIAKSLREYGYPDVTAAMVEEIHEAKRAEEAVLPHGIVGMFADSQLDDAIERGLLD